VPHQKHYVGYIQLIFADPQSDEDITIGGGGFCSVERHAALWANIPECGGDSDFIACRMNENGDIIAEKQVSAMTCEEMMGKPICELFAEAETRLAWECAKAGVLVRPARQQVH